MLAKAEHALVVFYAPWCGHCKKIKPEFEKAATEIKKQGVSINLIIIMVFIFKYKRFDLFGSEFYEMTSSLLSFCLW